MKNLIIYSLALILSLLAHKSFANDGGSILYNKKVNTNEAHKLGALHILKVSPILIGTSFGGGSLSYETGTGLRPLSLNTSFRYFLGSERIDDEDTIKIDEHFRFEIEPRLWLINYIDGVFIAPIFIGYQTNQYAYGGVLGIQKFIGNNLGFEAYAIIQSAPAIEATVDPIKFRFKIGANWAFTRKP